MADEKIMRLTAQQYKNIVEFMDKSYDASLNPPAGVKVIVITTGFRVGKAIYLGLNEYECVSGDFDGEEILAWKHI